MEVNMLTEAEVFSALRVLFSMRAEVNRNTLEAIQLADVKKAYRKRALDTHPDRFAGCGESCQKARSEQFIEVNEAYTTLSSYLRLREEKGFRFQQEERTRPDYSREAPPFRQPRAEPSPYARYSGPFHNQGFSFTFWQRGIPQRPLRLGEYLFYCGVIPWHLLIGAVVWQRKQRPRIGEIAQKWHWLTESQIRFYLQNRYPGELLGETLLRYNLISSFQLRVLLAHQQRVQEPIGRFFVYNRVLSEAQIKHYLEHQRIHNLCYDSDHRRRHAY